MPKRKRLWGVKYVCAECGETFIDEDISRKTNAIQMKSFACVKHDVPIEMKREFMYL